jgi:hypothetical protein
LEWYDVVWLGTGYDSQIIVALYIVLKVGTEIEEVQCRDPRSIMASLKWGPQMWPGMVGFSP